LRSERLYAPLNHSESKIVGSLDVMLITKFNTIFDADHRNSLFARQVSAITFFAQGSDYPSLANKSWEKCYDSDRKDVRSVLAFRAATGRTLCSGANGS
jgi:hypothetical protein